MTKKKDEKKNEKKRKNKIKRKINFSKRLLNQQLCVGVKGL